MFIYLQILADTVAYYPSTVLQITIRVHKVKTDKMTLNDTGSIMQEENDSVWA